MFWKALTHELKISADNPQLPSRTSCSNCQGRGWLFEDRRAPGVWFWCPECGQSGSIIKQAAALWKSESDARSAAKLARLTSIAVRDAELLLEADSRFAAADRGRAEFWAGLMSPDRVDLKQLARLIPSDQTDLLQRSLPKLGASVRFDPKTGRWLTPLRYVPGRIEGFSRVDHGQLAGPAIGAACGESAWRLPSSVILVPGDIWLEAVCKLLLSAGSQLGLSDQKFAQFLRPPKICAESLKSCVSLAASLGYRYGETVRISSSDRSRRVARVLAKATSFQSARKRTIRLIGGDLAARQDDQSRGHRLLLSHGAPTIVACRDRQCWIEAGRPVSNFTAEALWESNSEYLLRVTCDGKERTVTSGKTSKQILAAIKGVLGDNCRIVKKWRWRLRTLVLSFSSPRSAAAADPGWYPELGELRLSGYSYRGPGDQQLVNPFAVVSADRTLPVSGLSARDRELFEGPDTACEIALVACFASAVFQERMDPQQSIVVITNNAEQLASTFGSSVRPASTATLDAWASWPKFFEVSNRSDFLVAARLREPILLAASAASALSLAAHTPCAVIDACDVDFEKLPLLRGEAGRLLVQCCSQPTWWKQLSGAESTIYDMVARLLFSMFGDEIPAGLFEEVSGRIRLKRADRINTAAKRLAAERGATRRRNRQEFKVLTPEHVYLLTRDWKEVPYDLLTKSTPSYRHGRRAVEFLTNQNKGQGEDR